MQQLIPHSSADWVAIAAGVATPAASKNSAAQNARNRTRVDGPTGNIWSLSYYKQGEVGIGDWELGIGDRG